MTNKTFYLELNLSAVLITSEEEKEELLLKVNDCIKKIIENQKSVHFNSSVNVVSEEQIYAEYASAMSEDFN